MSATVKEINKRLKIYGSNDYGDPNFRVVFTDDETERRKGTFTDYHNNIFVRTVSEIREVPKYPWLKARFIIERWASGDKAYHPDLVTIKNGVYICIYVFQSSKDGSYLPPLWKVTEIIVDAVLHPARGSEIKSRDIAIEEVTKEKEIVEIQEGLAIQSENSKIKDRLSSRESASVGYSKILLTDQ